MGKYAKRPGVLPAHSFPLFATNERFSVPDDAGLSLVAALAAVTARPSR